MASAGAAAGAAHAQVVVNTDITVSTTWTANNVYDLQASVYVNPGATLTIQAGTRIASSVGMGGSLTICKGAQIFAQGTQFNPIIFTSSNDNGTWRHVNSEWGTLVIMGGAYVSTNQHAGNISTPDAANRLDMEGLLPQFVGDTRQQCGGGDDDDDTGSLTFVSLRYGGKVLSLGNELNGLSVGAVGRGTTIHHIDVTQNVDDGIETWGGTVNYKYLNIWNIGDDSFDFDCGWRGKAQFGLLVQGYSADGSQGGGVGDNCFEMDGAEDSDWQPVSTNVIANFTAIGQPLCSRRGTAWRDDDRTQFHNCIFMDIGQEVVHNDKSDGDHCTAPPIGGYGMGGSLDFGPTWTTSYTNTSLINAPVSPPPSYFYTSQTSGNLAEMKDCVFARNQYSSGVTDAYTTANSVNVFDVSNNNVLVTSILDADMPIQSMTRGGQVLLHGGTLDCRPVIALDPLPKNDALTSVGWQTEDGFFQSAHYRGAFAPGISWLRGWTSSEEWGLVSTTPMVDLGRGQAGVTGDPVLSSTGSQAALTTVSLDLNNANPNASTFLIIGFSELDAPIFGTGTLIPFPDMIIPVGNTDGSGSLSLSGTWPTGVPAHSHFYFQEFVIDPAGSHGFAISNGAVTDTP